MNDLRRATASLLAVSDSDEITAPDPQITMSLAYFNSLLYKIAQADGYEGTQSDFATAFAKALNGDNAIIGAADSKDKFPEVGEVGALYLDTSTGKIYYYEDGEYKQANADTEVTEQKLKDIVKNILVEDEDKTNEVINDATKEYLKDNTDIIDNATISYLVSNPENIGNAVDSYLDNNPSSITEGVKEFLSDGGGDLDTIVANSLKNAPETLADGVEKYLEEKPAAVEDAVEDYLTENPDKLTDAIDSYLDGKSDEFISEHYEAEVKDNETDDEIITDLMKDKKPVKNDIIIIKRAIVDDNFEYVSYYYDGKNWRAMSGNVNADHVYFDCDFIVTEQIGTIKEIENGQAKLEAKGKNLTQLLAGLFAQEKDPTITMPYVSITSTTAKNYEVGSIVKPTYTAAFVGGSYEFGPDTEIAALKWHIVNNFNDETSTAPAGKFAAVEVEDDTNLTITATATFNDGSIPVTNLGNEKPDKQIKAGTVSKTSAPLKGYRKTFYGITMDTEELNSNSIRDLESSTAAMKDGSVFSINVGQGSKRVIIAYPATLGDLSSVKDHGKFEIANTFTQTRMDIEGANGYTAIEYKVYTKIFDTELEEDTIYNVII